MWKCIGCCLIGLFYHSAVIAQTETYIGVDVHYVADRYNINDAGGHLQDAALDAAMAGIYIRHIVLKPLYLEAGFYTRAVRQGIAFPGTGTSTNFGRRAFMLPLRVGGKLSLFHEKLYICPVVGYVLAMTNNEELGKVDGTLQEFPGDTISFTWTSRYPMQTYSLVQACLSVDIRIFRKALLRISGSLYAGFEDILVEKVDYTVNGAASFTSTSATKGSFSSIGIGISLPIGRNSWIQ